MAANDLYQKALKAMFALKARFSNFGDIPVDLSFKLYDALIRPITTYGSEIWIADFNVNLSNFDTIPAEKLQHKFCKLVLGINKRASNLASRCETGRNPILLFVLSLMFNFYERCKQSAPDRLLHSAFCVDQGLYSDGSKSWYNTLSKIFKKMDLTENETKSLNSDIFNRRLLKYFTNQTKDKLDSNKINDDTKLKVFSNVLQFGNIPQYLKLNVPKEVKSNITKLRTSTHKLHIETGRYTRPKTPRNERTCNFCSQIETESHFLLFCVKYKSQRLKLAKAFNINDEEICLEDHENLLRIILNPKNKSQATELYKYIRTSLDMREIIT